ncbi:MAG: cation diffusion facilitator family transporter, partial [Chitinophagaceae bacterium]
VPRTLSAIHTGMILIGLSALCNFILGIYLIQFGKRIPSITISGNGQHVLTDSYSTLGLVFALIIIQITKWQWLDPAVSLLLAALILRKGYQLLRKAISGLMDETDLLVVDEVILILSANREKAWIDMHNMRIQQYGNNYHVDCHLTLPYYFDLVQVHAEIKSVAMVVNQHISVGEVEFFIHTDPCVPSCCPYCMMENCPVRQFPFNSKLNWTKDNLLPNRKHWDLGTFQKEPGTG